MKQPSRAFLQSFPSKHEEELTRVLTQHPTKSACAGLRRARFCLRRALLRCYDTTLAWDVKCFLIIKFLLFVNRQRNHRPTDASRFGPEGQETPPPSSWSYLPNGRGIREAKNGFPSKPRASPKPPLCRRLCERRKKAALKITCLEMQPSPTPPQEQRKKYITNRPKPIIAFFSL